MCVPPPPHDKTKYHSCMNATVKQDEKLFDIQNTIDGANKKKKVKGRLSLGFSHSPPELWCI